MPKALLTTRPIFHKTDAAIRGHIFCSFLAVLLRKELYDRLSARRRGNLEWQHIVDDLAVFVCYFCYFCYFSTGALCSSGQRDTVNLASRLTNAAVPGEILISERVRRALLDRLECVEVDALAIKGFAEPVRAWRLLGLRAQPSSQAVARALSDARVSLAN